MDDREAAILSPYPPLCLPEDVIQDGPRASWRGDLHSQGLTVAATVGTIWCNVPIGRFVRIRDVGLSQGGRLAPLYACLDAIDPLADHVAPTMGLWEAAGYVIRHWVRVDHLPLAGQCAWRARATAHVAEEIERCRAVVREMQVQRSEWKASTYRTTRLKLLRQIADYLVELDEERAILRAFSARHGVPVPEAALCPEVSGGDVGVVRPPLASYRDWRAERSLPRELPSLSILLGATPHRSG